MKTFSILKQLLALSVVCIIAGCGKDLSSISFGPVTLADKGFDGLKVVDSEKNLEAFVLYEKSGVSSSMKPYQNPPKFEYGENEYTMQWGSITVLVVEAEPIILELSDQEVLAVMAMEDLKAQLGQSRFAAPAP